MKDRIVRITKYFWCNLHCGSQRNLLTAFIAYILLPVGWTHRAMNTKACGIHRITIVFVNGIIISGSTKVACPDRTSWMAAKTCSKGFCLISMLPGTEAVVQIWILMHDVESVHKSDIADWQASDTPVKEYLIRHQPCSQSWYVFGWFPLWEAGLGQWSLKLEIWKLDGQQVVSVVGLWLSECSRTVFVPRGKYPWLGYSLSNPTDLSAEGALARKLHISNPVRNAITDRLKG